MTRNEAQAAMDAGTKIEAGEGEDHDTGYITEIFDHGEMAMVRWGTGVRTSCPVIALEAAAE